MPGPPPKPRNKRTRRNKDEGTSSTTIDLAAAPPTALTANPPRCPAGLEERTQKVWRSFWSTPIATQVESSDLPMLRRWIKLVELEQRLEDAVIDPYTDYDAEGDPHKMPGHLAYGSQGQIVEHPNAKLLLRISAELRAIEDRIGGSPMARFRLGWQKGEMTYSLARGASEAEAIAEAAASMAERHGQGGQ